MAGLTRLRSRVYERDKHGAGWGTHDAVTTAYASDHACYIPRGDGPCGRYSDGGDGGGYGNDGSGYGYGNGHSRGYDYLNDDGSDDIGNGVGCGDGCGAGSGEDDRYSNGAGVGFGDGVDVGCNGISYYVANCGDQLWRI